jgi:2-C-methyl-D-erythritol 4-phosphate cytidylyltransferase
MTQYAIIVAGGKGRRMEEQVPKQFLLLADKPIVMYSIEAFHKQNENTHIVLVLNEIDNEQWKRLCNQYDFNISHTVIHGGKERFYSVKNGLDFIFSKETKLDDLLIAIHDGARPLVSCELISRAFTKAKELKSVIPAVQSPDSIRFKEDQIKTHPLPREKVFMVQTPQVFIASILKRAFDQAFDCSFTDDASVVEKAGYPIHLIDGDIQNIKITYPFDITLAEYWLNSGSTSD